MSIMSNWEIYKDFLREVKQVIPKFRPELDRYGNHYLFEDKTEDELLSTQYGLMAITFNIDEVNYIGISQIHSKFEDVFGDSFKSSRVMTEFGIIFNMFNNQLSEYFNILSKGLAEELLKIADKISNEHLNQIKVALKRNYAILPDDIDIKRGFLEDFKKNAIPVLIPKIKTMNDLRRYDSLLKVEELINLTYQNL